MKTTGGFIHGGGWVRNRGQTRPRTQCFGALAVVWLALAVTGVAACSLTGWEQLALFLPVPVWLILAVHFFRSETPHPRSGRIPNPGCDPRKLY